MRITFLRNGQCDANLDSIHLLSRDTTLTPLGIQQSQKIIGHFDVVFCSPLRRCRQTLEHSHITYDELVNCQEVRDCIYNVNDIMENEKVSDDFIETDEAIASRCHKFFNILHAAYKEGKKNVLVLSHYGFVSEFTLRYASRRVELKNGELVKVEIHHSNRKSTALLQKPAAHRAYI